MEHGNVAIIARRVQQLKIQYEFNIQAIPYILFSHETIKYSQYSA